MQNIVVMLVVMGCAVGGVLSCAPCKCSVGYGNKYYGLHVAVCFGNTLTSIPSTLPLNTQVLFAGGASIHTIKGNQFASYNFKIFIMQKCGISIVERHALKNMASVTEINLSNNLISELPADLFEDTASLITVFLHHNKLRALSKNLFSNLLNLKVVWLTTNEITLIEPNCFVNLPQLQELHISGNRLTTLTIDIINNLPSVRTMSLNANPFHCDESLYGVMVAAVARGWSAVCETPLDVKGKEWKNVKVTVHNRCSPCLCVEPSGVRCSAPLNLNSLPDKLPSSTTHLNVTDQQFTTLNNSAFSSYELLQELHLERNNIHKIELNAFLNLNNLSVLNLAHNYITNLEKKIFKSCSNLAKILLNNNNLKRLTKYLFLNLAMLEEVDLSFNNITFIQTQCFVNVSSLRTINLRNNQLQTLRLNVMDSFVSLERLYLDGNPWRCYEALCGVMDTVVGRALWGPGGVVPVCATPPSLAGKVWNQLLQHFHPDILTLDSNKNWTPAEGPINVWATNNVTLHCSYCFVSRVTWTLRGVEPARSYQRTSQEAHISNLTIENIQKEEGGDYVCQVSECPECASATSHVTVNTLPPIDPRMKVTAECRLYVSLECGEVISKGVTFIVNGISVNQREFPWHVAIYRLEGEQHKYRCGGSIVTPLIIITAAHCLTNETGSKLPTEDFYIGAGKYYSNYNSTGDIYAQIQQVKEYYFPGEYSAVQSNFAGDLAVAIVKQAFQMTHAVQPVCLDLDSTMESEQLQNGRTGSVVGWGSVDPNTSQKSAELQRLDPLFVNRDQCLNEVPSEFRRWVTLDKFCAGFRNGSSVCTGDSGGGLVFKWTSTQKYFLRGLVSVGPAGKQLKCDNFHYGVYTKISFYSGFIQNIINKNSVND